MVFFNNYVGSSAIEIIENNVKDIQTIEKDIYLNQ